MNPKLVLWVSIAVVIVVVIALASRPAGSDVQNVDAAGVKSAAAAGAQLIDVRTPGEFQMGHVAGAINVPLDQFEAAAQGWDKELTYVVYCATGSRSTTAIQTMQALGFTSIKHFAAGLQAWDGGLEKGSASSAEKIETSGKPVLVEFYTDT
jgi:rhodanese-related sulfurtransferase